MNATDPTTPAATSSRPVVQSLPGVIKRTFSEDFVPLTIEEIGCSDTPWQTLDIDLIQGCVDIAFPGLDYVADKGGALDTLVSQPSFFPNRSSC